MVNGRTVMILSYEHLDGGAIREPHNVDTSLWCGDHTPVEGIACHLAEVAVGSLADVAYAICLCHVDLAGIEDLA